MAWSSTGQGADDVVETLQEGGIVSINVPV
jgi:hypothetical protein